MFNLLLAAFAAQALVPGTPAFDPHAHKKDLAGQPSDVLVLGSPHLSQLPKPIDPVLLDPLLDRLAAFHPDVIAVENISGEQCETLQRFQSQHGDAWDSYCQPTDAIEKATGLNVDQALAEIDRTLASLPTNPAPADHRRLAMLFLAANDRPSAVAQWLQLAPAERHSGDGLTDEMVKIVDRTGKPLNESYTIASALAARLGLQRIYLMDDHSADWPVDEKTPYGKAYGEALQKVWSAKPEPAIRTQYLEHQSHLQSSGDLLDFYRFLNDPETQRQSIASDMGAASSSEAAQPYGRQYLSWWETRNLRMAANIHSAFAQKPGARVLVIVGATHKGHLDYYLDMLRDVRLVDAEAILK